MAYRVYRRLAGRLGPLGRGFTLQQAEALAGGFTDWAFVVDLESGLIIRVNETAPDRFLGTTIAEVQATIRSDASRGGQSSETHRASISPPAGRCLDCGETNQPDHLFCESCGAQLRDEQRADGLVDERVDQDPEVRRLTIEIERLSLQLAAAKTQAQTRIELADQQARQNESVTHAAQRLAELEREAEALRTQIAESSNPSSGSADSSKPSSGPVSWNPSDAELDLLHVDRATSLLTIRYAASYCDSDEALHAELRRLDLKDARGRPFTLAQVRTIRSFIKAQNPPVP